MMKFEEFWRVIEVNFKAARSSIFISLTTAHVFDAQDPSQVPATP